MKRIISFSLYGNSRMYIEGAIQNIEEAKCWYPGWICRFYTAIDCPGLRALQKRDCEVVVMPPMNGLDRTRPIKDWHGCPSSRAMTWRFLAFGDLEAEYIISRDCDSRVNPREAAAVRAWIDSGALFHMMCENENHLISSPQGGMVGVVGGLFPDIARRLEHFDRIFPQLNQAYIFYDIHCLRHMVMSDVAFSIFGTGHGLPTPFPPHEPLQYGSYVGEIIHEEWRNEPYTYNELETV